MEFKAGDRVVLKHTEPGHYVPGFEAKAKKTPGTVISVSDSPANIVSVKYQPNLEFIGAGNVPYSIDRHIFFPNELELVKRKILIFK